MMATISKGQYDVQLKRLRNHTPHLPTGDEGYEPILISSANPESPTTVPDLWSGRRALLPSSS